jgi:AcrR family transcriptional regulator
VTDHSATEGAVDRRTQLLQATIGVIARRGVRGMRVQEIAADAGVSVPLLYHYFGNREGLLEAAMLLASEQAGGYSARAAQGAATARAELEARLLGELQDTEEVRTNSAAWGELRWSAVFEDNLRPVVQRLTREWVQETARLVERVVAEEGGSVELDSRAAAERLVALVEGLSGRWLTGAAKLAGLRRLLRQGIEIEVPRPGGS